MAEDSANNTIGVDSEPKPFTPTLDGERLEEALLKQIEYYFSRQNLANDAYLVSQMDADMWVSIETIAGFKKVGTLTSDVDFIARVMAKSQSVVVDPQRKLIKPSWKLQRNTIILRDVPSDATAEEVRALFDDKLTITDVHSDVANSWFVSFDTEDTALDAMMSVRNKQIRGNEVKARMKSEHLLKTTTPYVTGVSSEAYGYYPRGVYMGPQGYAIAQGQYWQADRAYRGGRRAQNSVPNDRALYKDGKKVTPTTTPRTEQGDRKGVKARKSKKAPENKPLSLASVPQMTSQHFPPLGGRQRAGSFKTGYAKEFKKFTKDDIVRIIQTVTELASTEILPAAKECGVLASAPNKTLEITNAPPPPPPAAVPSVTPPVVQEPIKEWPQREWPEKQPAKADSPPNNPEALPKEIERVAQPSPVPSPVTPVKSIPKVPSYADIALGVSRTASPPIAPGSPNLAQSNTPQPNNNEAKLT